jgi:hypothetical protein
VQERNTGSCVASMDGVDGRTGGYWRDEVGGIGKGWRGVCQGTSGRPWEFLPDRTWAEIWSGLRPDMVAGISGQKTDYNFFGTARER